MNPARIRIRERPPRQQLARAPGKCVVETGAIGFLGAADDDQQRWITAFRRLLDGLDHPLQVVMTFTPGSGESINRDRVEVPNAPAEMRLADLEFADALAASPGNHARGVALVTDGAGRDGLLESLRDIGVPVTGTGVVDETPAATFGRETPNAFANMRGWHRTWSLLRYPGFDLEPGWLLRLVPPGLEISLSWHVQPLPAGWIIDYLQRQLVNMRATRAEQAERWSSSPELAGALPNVEDLQRRLTASEEKAFHVALYLTVSMASEAKLADGSARVEAAARASLCTVQPCTFRMFEARLATLPLGVDRLHRCRVLDTSSLATFFPWLDADLRQPKGLVLGSSRATGSPVLLDNFDDARFANANIGVFGHSGAGKTHLLSAIAMGAVATGAQVFVIDPEHEYGGIARLLGGVDIELALGSGHALNVLDLRAQPGSGEAWLGPAVADAVDLLAVICGGLDEPERAMVEAAVRETFEAEAEPVLRDVGARLPGETRVAKILKRWVSGSLGTMFSSRTNVDLEAPLVVFGMRELREEMIAPVHFLLAEALWNRIKARGRRRLLVVDELGLLFEDATIRRFVVTLARRIRKYDGALVFATQNPGDLLSTDAGAVVATNPAIHFFGAQRPGEAVKLQRTFQLSDAQRVSLENARRGEFLLSAAADRLPLRVQAAPWQMKVMSIGRAPPRATV